MGFIDGLLLVTDIAANIGMIPTSEVERPEGIDTLEKQFPELEDRYKVLCRNYAALQKENATLRRLLVAIGEDKPKMQKRIKELRRKLESERKTDKEHIE